MGAFVNAGDSIGDRFRAAVMRLALNVASAAYEEAMRNYGLNPDAIKVISADAHANIEHLDEAHHATLGDEPASPPGASGR
ncbi:hypothetical protein [Actinomadura hibisca]|uniref:hypothetical protein n=1 Tax=Actinomadura hibisca TaxID=68565 RepID=UPI000AC68978|nr:hypothetical protein [Actinomadura hibisca]